MNYYIELTVLFKAKCYHRQRNANESMSDYKDLRTNMRPTLSLLRIAETTGMTRDADALALLHSLVTSSMGASTPTIFSAKVH